MYMVIYCACSVHNVSYAGGPPHPPQIPPVSINVACAVLKLHVMN